MSIIIRLQNLPWAADSSDIRRYFAGLSIPEGGVHIVGGEMGDAFIAFSSDEDARLAMAKDGGKIHEMQIKLLLSSRQEMARVIERARQQNLALQSAQIVPPMQPPPFPNIPQLQQPIKGPTPVESDRHRGHSPTPPRRRSRERIDSRDRRRSPEGRRSTSSKRDRSRSPSRSSRGSSRDRDTRDRRSDRSSRDDRRYSKEDSRYSNNRYSERNRHPDEDHNNSRPQGYPDTNQNSTNQTYQNYTDQKSASNNSYSFNNQPNFTVPKDYLMPPSAPSNTYAYNNPSTAPSSSSAPSNNNYPYVESTNPLVPKPYHQSPYYNSNDLNSTISSVDRTFGLDKVNIAALLNETSSASPTSYMQKTSSYDAPPYQQHFAPLKSQVPSSALNESAERKRKSRFEPVSDPTQPLKPPFPLPDVFQKLGVKLEPQILQNIGNEQKSTTKGYQPVPNTSRVDWPQQNAPIKNENWNNLSNAIQSMQSGSDPKITLGSVAIPMELDPPEEPSIIYSRGINEPAALNNQVPERSNLPMRNNDGSMGVPPQIVTAPDRKQWHGPTTQTVELRRLPYDTRIEDILRLFRNIPLNPSNVCMLRNNHRVEGAFIRFSSLRDFNEAMNSQPVYIKNSTIELIPCPASAFESAVASQSIKPRPKITPKETDLILQLKGLPFQCAEYEVVKFFSDLQIIDMFLERQPDGKCSGVGFVQFASMADFKHALTLNGRTIGHRYITLRIANKEMLEYARDESVTPQNIHSREPTQEPPTEIMQREPPPRESMQRQFQPRESLHRQPPPRESMQRQAPLRQSMQREPPLSESMQREHSPKEPIQRKPLLKEPTQREPLMREPLRETPTIEASRKESPMREPPNREQTVRHPPIRDHAMREPPMREAHPDLKTNKFGGRRPDFEGRDIAEPPMAKPVRGNFCVAMRGLPKSVTSANLGKFFKEMDITALGIHIIVDNSVPTGEAFVEVATQREVDIAVSKNGIPFHNCHINMYCISIEELDRILTMGVLPPPSAPLLGNQADDNRSPKRPLLAQAPILKDRFRDGPRFDYPPNERARHPGPMRGGRPMRPPMGDRHARPLMGDRHARPPMGRMRGHRPENRKSPDRGPAGFGAPGCVVAVNNLHFNAGLEELLKFFKGFRVSKDNIMRRYNEHQQPTGEARVCFENPKEALRAVRELDTKSIMGRSLHLAVL